MKIKNLVNLSIGATLFILLFLGCSSSSRRPAAPEKESSIEASPLGRRGVAKQLQSAFAGFDEVSIYTKGDSDEVLYVGWEGLTERDKFRADETVDRFRTKIRGYGFTSIEFGNKLRTLWTYGVKD